MNIVFGQKKSFVMKCLTKLYVSLSLLFSIAVGAADFTVGSGSIIDLRTQEGASQWDVSDDGLSEAIDLGFTFEFYGNEYTQGHMATNGCWSFTTDYCYDYTPDPLPNTVYTIYPFWTDLIRDNGSRMLTKYFDSPDGDGYFIAGWYDLREYYRNSDNTFEMWLYENSNNIEFRYGELDISNHDVLIGIQGSMTEYDQYLFHDECATGTTNISSSCVNNDWNNTSHNTSLENNSLIIEADITARCIADPLYSIDCTGYAQAYFNQQCEMDALYDVGCAGYAQSYFNQQCGIDVLYNVNCDGYALAYFNQQCGIDALYDVDCSGYDAAYMTQQCSFDTLYHSSCPGYRAALEQQQAIADSHTIEEEEIEDGTYSQEENDMFGLSPDEMYINEGYDSEEEFYGYETEILEPPYNDMGYDEEEIQAIDQFYQEEAVTFEPENLFVSAQPETGLSSSGDGSIPFNNIEATHEEASVVQLDEAYIFEELEITDNWLSVEDDWAEDAALEEEEASPLEEQAEELFEDLEEIAEETEILFIEDEALEELINEEELELLLDEEVEEEEDNVETFKEKEEATLDVEKKSKRVFVRSKGPSFSGPVLTQEAAVALNSVIDMGVQGMEVTGATGPVSALEDESGDSFLREQGEQTSGIQEFQAAETGPEIVSSPFEVAEQQQEQQTQDELVFEEGETFAQSDIQFEENFNEAIAVGGDIGTFLSQQAPDFGRFDVAPPTVTEQRITQAVESLADQIGAAAAQENLQGQLDVMMQEGGFDTDQTAAVVFMGYREGFSQYTQQTQIPDQGSWYISNILYAKEDVQDNNFSFYMMAGKSQKKLNEMVNVGYK